MESEAIDMLYGQMPLYPALGPDCRDDTCVRVPMFGGGSAPGPGMPPVAELRRVTLENPCRPGEWAEVTLGVDACGNLAVCVRRDDRCPPPRPRRPCPPPDPCRPCPPPRPHCRRGRLYGDWDNR